MEITRLQNELLNLDVTHKGYELLMFLKKNYFTDIVGADLQKKRPLSFREARDVKQAYDELVNADLIAGDYLKGNITRIVPNIDKLIQIEDVSGGITVVKKAVKKKSTSKSEISDAVKDVLLAYNSHATLPRPSTPTPLVVSRIEEKLSVFSPEQIKNALELAANAKWLVNKGSEKWCNCAWVINVIQEFMEGGKYYKTADLADTNDKYKIEDDNTTVFW